MTRLPASVFFALSLATFAVGCGEDEKISDGSSSKLKCDDDSDEIGESCECADEDESEGAYECNSGKLECSCEVEDTTDTASGKDEDETPEDEDEESTKPADSGKKPANTPTPGSNSKPDAGPTGTTGKDSGPATTPPATGGDDGGTTAAPAPSGPGMPTIPKVSGACPEFKNGTATIAGHSGVALQVGTPGKKGPVLFYWHGTGSSSSEVNSIIPAEVRKEILDSGGIIASFNGRNSAKGAGDCSGTGAHNISDFLAADQLIACAVEKDLIDPTRIYTTGCSAGGLQSGCMAQVRSSYIAAATPNSGGVVFPQKWQDKNTPAIFTMHGGSSDVVIVTFSETSASLDKSAKTQGSFVVNCNHGGGHCAARGAIQVAAWKFMKDHPFGTKPDASPWKAGIPSGVPDYCKVF